MKTHWSIAAALTVSLAASASVNEPNGLVVPINSGGSETQLSALFSSRGEAINWVTDAHTTPNQFSPLCGFTATYVLNQAGSHLGLAWYNDTGIKPQANALHTLVPANSPVGTMFNGASIKSDPAYTGGLVGFALIGGEVHYSNASYDTLCSNCQPAGSWVTALIYPSSVTPNAFYVCFEDGATSASGWNNDGDFNDDVYFITGVTCEGGGQPCSTGLKGICNDGLSQCGGPGTVSCKQVNQPGAETCNGLDDDCDGLVDDGSTCGAGLVCVRGACGNGCGGEFGCAGNQVCQSDVCVDPECASVSCDAGLVCGAGQCKGPCDGVVCPGLQVCRVGRCVDSCNGVTCQAGQVCSAGICVTGCDCKPCGTGKSCDTASKRCVETSCVSVSCGTGTFCLGGACVDDCANAKCPGGQVCKVGQCVAAPDAGTVRSDGGSAGADGGQRADGGPRADGGTDGGSGGTTGGSTGCSCGSASVGSMAILLALAAAMARRRRA